MQAGIIEEMVEDTLEDALGDDDELEDDAQEEVDKVLFELTAGLLFVLYSDWMSHWPISRW
ncbi:MAG: Snf7 family protein [Bacteroidota bacterium]